MISKIIFALLPLISLADIEVDVKVGKSMQQAAANAFGERIDIISSRERSSFGLSHEALKNAVGKYAGRNPDDAFLHSPTPWDDLYKRYNWDQVRTKLRPISTRVLGVRTNPIIVGRKHFKNDSPYPAKYSGEISQQIWTTVSTTTSTQYDITVGQQVKYKLNFGLGGVSSLTYNYNWGEAMTKSEMTILSSGSSISMNLQPGQSATATLTANKGTMDVEVEYEATLSGDVACNYGNPHKGHHFWAYDVNAVLRAAGKPTSFRAKEKITIGFYSDERVVAYDGAGKQIA